MIFVGASNAKEKTRQFNYEISCGPVQTTRGSFDANDEGAAIVKMMEELFAAGHAITGMHKFANVARGGGNLRRMTFALENNNVAYLRAY